MSARTSVPGEELPPLVGAAFTVIGIASAAGACLAWSGSIAFARAATAPIVLAHATAPTAARPAATLTPPLAASTAAPRAPQKCPPLVIEFVMAGALPPSSAQPSLDALGRWLVAHPAVAVVIDGHADATGSEDTNLRLSRQRASLVGLALSRAGVDRSRITTRGFGAYWPVDESPPDASWNRRVVVETKGDACPREKEEVVEP